LPPPDATPLVRYAEVVAVKFGVYLSGGRFDMTTSEHDSASFRVTPADSFYVTRRQQGVYEIVTRQRVAIPRDDAFRFFGDVANVARVMPPWLVVDMLSPPPVEIGEGARLDSLLRIFGVPVQWQSELTVWEPPHRFAYEQRRGPFRRWRHEHFFTASGRTTIVDDRAVYAVPGGRVVNDLLVERLLKAVFRHRARRLQELLGC
jgi:ligand-binding SRPBCC domain-containing protein